MCVILLVLKKENNEKLNEVIKNNVFNFAVYNGDGVAVLATSRNKNTEPLYYRGLEYKQDIINKAVSDYDFLNFHFRQATTGEKSNDNCHLWQKDNWIFSHNGTIYDMGNKKICDSLDFFNSLFDKKFLKKNKIKYEAIQDYMLRSRYTGRSVIYNTELKKAYLFGDFKTFALDKNYLAICSADIETTSIVSLFNVGFEVESEDTTIEKLEVELDGVHIIDYQKEKIYQLADRLTSYYSEGRRGSFLKNKWESDNEITNKKGVVKEYLSDGNGHVTERIISDNDDPIDPYIGKRLSEMTDDEIEIYYQTQSKIAV